MNNLTQRLITGAIFVIVLVGCIWFSEWTFAILALVITVLGLWEFYKLAQKSGAYPQRYYGIFLGASAIVLAFLAKTFPSAGIFLPLLPLLFMVFFIELFRKKSNPFNNIAWTITGHVYITLPFALLIYAFVPTKFVENTMHPEYAEHYTSLPVLTIFILIWVSDSMAYVFGRLLGKHKLWERISPKKTWEGFIGGLLFTVATGAGIAHWSIDKPDFSDEIIWGVVGFVISWTGMLGDLVESMLKRSIDVKDSGAILPGHGGILDRFDALFLAIPFALTAYWICGELLHLTPP